MHYRKDLRLMQEQSQLMKLTHIKNLSASNHANTIQNNAAPFDLRHKNRSLNLDGVNNIISGKNKQQKNSEDSPSHKKTSKRKIQLREYEVKDHSEIYFNNGKKYNYMKNIIDKYFEEGTKHHNKNANLSQSTHQYHQNPSEFQTTTPKLYTTIVPQIFNRNHINRSNPKKQFISLSIRSKDTLQPTSARTDKSQAIQQKYHKVVLSRKKKLAPFIRQSPEEQLIANNQMKEKAQELNGDLSESIIIQPGSQGGSVIIQSGRYLPAFLPEIQQSYEQKYYLDSNKNEDDEDFPRDSLNTEYSLSHFTMDHNKNGMTAESQFQQKIFVYQNQIFKIQIIMVQNIPKYKIKTYKQRGQEILKREIKVLNMNLQSIWTQYQYDHSCLISPFNQSVKDLLFKAKRVDQDAKYFMLKAKKYHKKLLASNNSELMRIICEFCQHLMKVQGKVINNKINPNNLYIVKNDNVRLAEWGYSSFHEKQYIQEIQFKNRKDPILKSSKEWFVTPQYLAPEIIAAMIKANTTDLNSEDHLLDDVLEHSSSDVWSLGVTIFEILTIVPVWITQKCRVHGKEFQGRTGILATVDRDLSKILKKQLKIQCSVKKVIQEEMMATEINQKLRIALMKMLEPNPTNRSTFKQIISSLQ